MSAKKNRRNREKAIRLKGEVCMLSYPPGDTEQEIITVTLSEEFGSEAENCFAFSIPEGYFGDMLSREVDILIRVKDEKDD